jgi:hypothetical protein
MKEIPAGLSRRYRRRLGVYTCLLGVFVGLVITEVVLQALGAVQEFRTYSATRGWRLRPGAAGWNSREGQAYVTINADGWRGPRVTPHKPPNTLRIAVLGDSFVQAVHVPYEQSVCAVLQHELTQRCRATARQHVEVLNFGVLGYGTAQELLTLREEVWRYDPDVVVLALFTGNDLRDNSVALDTGSYITAERCRPYFRIAHDSLILDAVWMRHTLLSLFCRINFAARQIAVLRIPGEVVLMIRLGLTPWGRVQTTVLGSKPGIEDALYAPPADAVWRDAWDITEYLLVTMAREVMAHNARFLAVTLSNPMQVYPDLAVRHQYLTAVGGMDLFYPEHRLQQLGAREGFEVLPLAPAMQAEADRTGVFFHGFPKTGLGLGHWNAQGHAFAGQVIGRTLCAASGSNQ